MERCFLYVTLLIASLLSACATGPTMVTVESDPPGAKVVLENLGIEATTDKNVEIPNVLFEQGHPEKQIRNETFVFTLDGYRVEKKDKALQKHEPNKVHAKLSPLDSTLTIKSDPPGAEITLGCSTTKNLTKMDWENILPEDWSEEFTTPKTFVCTKKEARKLNDARLYIQAVELDGFYASRDAFENSNSSKNLSMIHLAPGRDTTILIPMKPVITRLQVISNPPGAIVDDINDGGFGYLGETPLIRNFNWEDVRNWQAKQSVRRGSYEKQGKQHETVISFSALNLKLRISKAGYEDVYLKNLRVPIGQERAFRKDLRKIVSQINFASDPQGVHVYVERELEKEVYNVENNKLTTVPVQFKKHLGTTPFTFNISPNDPIKHGEKLIFEKSGYINATMHFALGNDSYHQVMKPEKVMER